MESIPQSGNAQRRGARKRNRPPVSCNHCRVRRSKCDRAKPCQSCVKSGDATTCSYASNRSIASHEDKFSSDQPTRDELVSRIDRLERLVLSAMSNIPQPALPFNETSQSNAMLSGTSSESIPHESANENQKAKNGLEIDQLSMALGVMKEDPAQVVYLGGAHWVSIMSEIHEFRTFLYSNPGQMANIAIENRATARLTSSSLLRGTSPPKTLERLVSSIPARSIADKLIARYFVHNGSVWPIIHEPTFRKQYHEHWNDPMNTNMMWLAVLFGVFNHAIISYEETEDSTATLELGAGGDYKNKAIDCLVAGDYANPGVHTIEALILYAQAEWVTSQDATVEISVVIGMIIRLAMRMGIHRDSRSHPELTTFQGEMRRRLWAAICVMDILYSFQLSLPAVVQRGESDCELPRNIFDHEFDENIKELPSPRPLTDITEVSYLIPRTQMLLVFQEILTFTESRNSISVENVMKYEEALDEVWRKVPTHFRLPPPGESTVPPLCLKRTRMNLDRVYQMAQCVLYRKFIRQVPAITQNRKRCIDAAMALLSHQATIYLDCDSTPSIYPQNIRKRHFATLTTHDFFAACMAIALDLHFGFGSQPFGPRSDDIALWGYDKRSDMIIALEVSTEFWRISQEESVEAAKAYSMFSFVLENVKKAQSLTASTLGTNLSMGETSGNFEAAFSNFPIDARDSTWPTKFDSNAWNFWKGDTEGLESLIQWPRSEIETSESSIHVQPAHHQ